MTIQTCASCGQEFQEWVEYCPHCSEPVANYARPAGFWIRVGASIVDTLIFIPIMILAFWNTYSLKNTTVLVLISVPGFFYKPFMEAFFGASLGKMSCGIKVVDAQGKKLSLFCAYIRAFPFLMAAGVGLAAQAVLFSSPQFQAATSFVEIGQARPETFLNVVNPIVNLLILVDCVVVAFSFRKRALHDMLAESYCVYREP
jgi:uncharacterized RDD family membrane protein YckC